MSTQSIAVNHRTMDISTSSMRELVQQILAAEAANNGAQSPHAPNALQVLEKLQITITRFAGAEGFRSLLRRALALARVDISSLTAVSIKPDGTLDWRGIQGEDETAIHPEGSIVITANLLDLLVIFIGQPLTLRLVREAWPKVF